MYHLWARARPTLTSYYRRCRCYTCLSHPSDAAVLRRPATGEKLAPWRRLTTLFYSSLVCTGAVLDAEVKKRRRKRWDTVIAKAENDLAAGKVRQASQMAALNAGAAEESDILDELGGHAAADGSMNHQRPPEGMQDPQLEHDPGPHTRIPFDRGVEETERVFDRRTEVLWLLNTSRTSRRKAQINAPNSIYADAETRGKPRIWTPKKLVTTEYAMAKLATRLLLGAETPVGYKRPSSVSPETQTSLRERHLDLVSRLYDITLEDALELTNVTRLESPRYNPNLEEAVEIIQSLDGAISSLFWQREAGRISTRTLATKIAYNLMVSPAPPHQTTLTTIINGFSRIEEYDMAEAAIDAVFEGHMRVDETAVHGILVHWIRKNDFGGFSKFHRKIQGFHGGLMLAKSGIRMGAVSSHRLWAVGNKVIQGIDLDAALYGALVTGYLRFNRATQAAAVYNQMLSAGFRPDVGLLAEYLANATREGDWERGISVWRRIEAHFLPAKVTDRVARGSGEHMAIRRALQHCKHFNNSSEYTEIYRRGLQHGLRMDALLPHALPAHYIRPYATMANLQRRVRIVLHKAELHAADLQAWALQVLASKMLLAGRSIAQVRDAFAKYDNLEAYTNWYKGSGEHLSTYNFALNTSEESTQVAPSKPSANLDGVDTREEVKDHWAEEDSFAARQTGEATSRSAPTPNPPAPSTTPRRQRHGQRKTWDKPHEIFPDMPDFDTPESLALAM